MIIGIGTDIIEIRRVEKALLQKHFCDKVFSASEQEFCNSRGKQGMASYAGRWAAKEAVGKAMGCGLSGGKLNELEILSAENGRPFVKISESWQKQIPERAEIFISISHSKEYAIAECIIEIEK